MKFEPCQLPQNQVPNEFKSLQNNKVVPNSPFNVGEGAIDDLRYLADFFIKAAQQTREFLTQFDPVTRVEGQ